MVSVTLRYIQPANKTLMKYTDHLFAKSRKVEDISDEAALNDIKFKEVDCSFCQNVQEYRAPHPHTDVTDNTIKMQSLLAMLKIQIRFVKPALSTRQLEWSKDFAGSN